MKFNCLDTSWGSCVFEKPCKDVPDKNLDLKVNIYDSNQEWFFTVPQKDLMISGKVFGDSDDKCYLAVMNNNKEQESHNAWFIGNILLQDYYVVFDATN